MLLSNIIQVEIWLTEVGRSLCGEYLAPSAFPTRCNATTWAVVADALHIIPYFGPGQSPASADA